MHKAGLLLSVASVAVATLVGVSQASSQIFRGLGDRVEQVDTKKIFDTVKESKCIEVSSQGSFDCKDGGNFDSTCATATCPSDYTLTGGGGACDAGDRKIKSLFPELAKGEYTIACESQGVAPTAIAICCKL